MRAWLGIVLAHALALVACDEPGARRAPPPVLSENAPDDAPTPPVAEPEAPVELVAATEPAAPEPVSEPEPAIEPDERALRIEAWLSTPFRCRAISTTRLRACRFEREGEEVAITFPIADLTCRRVVWDEHGDPSRLERCRSAWLRVPATIDLTRRGDTWSGSHSGWRGRGGDSYCCPGVWINAPDALREGAPDLEPLDADRETPPPKSTR